MAHNTTTPTRTVFISTSWEGLTTLELLHDMPEVELVAVLTQPDRPVGRKQEMTPTAIMKRALELGLKVYEEENREVYEEILKNENPDLAIVLSYGNMIPESFLNALKLNCLNVHYSLLPELRGAVPVQKAILEDLKKTGVTIQVMEKTLDTGPIVAQGEVEIEKNETTETLKEKLIPLGVDLMKTSLPKWIRGEIEPEKQDDSKATFCSPDDIAKKNAEIDWENMESVQIERMVRAFLPWPVAWMTLPDGKKLKIFEGELVEFENESEPGDILNEQDRLLFATKDSKLVYHAKSVQLEGKQQMDDAEFLRGRNQR